MHSHQSNSLALCPNCNSTFLVTAEEMQSALGAVRCGECMKIFNATYNLVNTEQSANETAADLAFAGLNAHSKISYQIPTLQEQAPNFSPVEQQNIAAQFSVSELAVSELAVSDSSINLAELEEEGQFVDDFLATWEEKELALPDIEQRQRLAALENEASKFGAKQNLEPVATSKQALDWNPQVFSGLATSLEEDSVPNSSEQVTDSVADTLVEPELDFSDLGLDESYAASAEEQAAFEPVSQAQDFVAQNFIKAEPVEFNAEQAVAEPEIDTATLEQQFAFLATEPREQPSQPPAASKFKLFAVVGLIAVVISAALAFSWLKVQSKPSFAFSDIHLAPAVNNPKKMQVNFTVQNLSAADLPLPTVTVQLLNLSSQVISQEQVPANQLSSSSAEIKARASQSLSLLVERPSTFVQEARIHAEL